MSKFENILKDIKSIKIQGATNVALAGIKAFLIRPDEKSAKEILSTRPTEPLMQNSIGFLLNSKNPKKDSKKLFSYIKNSKKKIAKKGAKLIKNDMNIYSHCHSSSVIEILKQAKKNKKKFVVYTTEVEPLLQGRKTAKELSKAGIKVIIGPDLAAAQLLKKCDLFLFGADAFLKKGVANKIGTSTLCKIAKDHNIPRYSCGISLKFTEQVKIEKRNSREVWDEREKNIEVENIAFDLTKKDLLSGVISEIGVLSYTQFFEKSQEKIQRLLGSPSEVMKINKKLGIQKQKEIIKKQKEEKQKELKQIKEKLKQKRLEEKRLKQIKKEKIKKEKQLSKEKKKIEIAKKKQEKILRKNTKETRKDILKKPQTVKKIKYIEDLEIEKHTHKSLDDKILILNKISKQFFNEVFGFSENDNFDYLLREFKKLKQKKCSDFCNEMIRLHYSKTDLTREKVNFLMNNLIKLINSKKSKLKVIQN